MVSESELWLLSYYRQSEINGALFFGRVARAVRDPALQADITQHFADEAAHAALWTRCINDLGAIPLKLPSVYQDSYLDAAGLPIGLIEVLAVTQVFERRVISQYRRHMSYPRLHSRVRDTFQQIMVDERWHVRYVRQALNELGLKHGQDNIRATLSRYKLADDEVYADALREHSERLAFLFEQASD